MMSAPRENFDTIDQALTSVFIVIIGEDWNSLMYNYNRAVGTHAVFYFVLVFCFGNFMLLSLFTAILLQNFEEDSGKAEESEEEEVDPNMSYVLDSE